MEKVGMKFHKETLFESDPGLIYDIFKTKI